MNPNASLLRSYPHRLLLFTVAGLGSLALGLTATVRGADGTAPAAMPAITPANPATDAKAPTFADIRPVFEKYCYACHGGTLAPEGTAANSKAKSGLTLDTLANVLKGGRSKKPGIVPGKSAEGEIMIRIQLAPTEKNVMPPKGKTAPTADDIKKLVDWVNAGAN